MQLNTILENDVAWLSNGELIVLAVPERRGEAPVFEAPSGPTIQESMGRPSPERTLQDLLRNSQDEALFAYHARSALRRVDLARRSSQQIGTPDLFAKIEVLGKPGVLLTERLRAPFSYQVGWQSFSARSSCAMPRAGCCAIWERSSSRKACRSKA